jgi:hypothetical protein
MALRAVPGATAAALLEAEELSSQTKLYVDLRIMTHAVAVVPYAVGCVHGNEFHMREATRVLDRAKVEVNRETTVRTDRGQGQGTHQGPPLDAGVYRRDRG